MRHLWLLAALYGCAYMTQAEFDEARDPDGDGWPVGEDCANDAVDGAENVYPSAPDVRGDGCDADCGATPDADGDDWPDDADCGPNDPAMHPCSGAEVEGDGIDHDCDGQDAVRADACPTLDPTWPATEQVAFTPERCPHPAAPGAE